MQFKTSSLFHVSGRPGDFVPSALPQVAFMGRSNCGKSSLINALCNRKNLARTSSTPGKTRTVNFFLVDDSILLTDLPGFGYAKVSKTEAESWKYLVESYLDQPLLRGGCILMDIRREPREEERELAAYMARLGVPTMNVLTKADKLGKQEFQREMKRWQLALFGAPCIAVSAKTHQGIDDLIGWIHKVTAQA
jgi:GTP-binding protein